MVSGLAADGPADRGLYAQNRWAAARFGRQAELVHPDGSRLASVPELVEELTERLGARSPDLSDQAEEQLELGRSDGLESLCRRLVDLT
jgi:gamma-glutamyl:cysteine ligase YbdK (ATP-grasp superfamily)